MRACLCDIIELRNLPPELRFVGSGASETVSAGLSLKSMEALRITDALRHNRGNRKAAADELGIHPSTLFRKIKELSIDTPKRDGRSRTPK